MPLNHKQSKGQEKDKANEHRGIQSPKCLYNGGNEAGFSTDWEHTPGAQSTSAQHPSS